MKRRALFAFLMLISISGFSVLGCGGGGSSDATIPDGASSVEAPTDNPAEEDAEALADGP